MFSATRSVINSCSAGVIVLIDAVSSATLYMVTAMREGTRVFGARDSPVEIAAEGTLVGQAWPVTSEP